MTIQRLHVGSSGVLRAPRFRQERVLRPDRRIIQPRGNRVRQAHLPFFVLQEIAECPVQDSG